MPSGLWHHQHRSGHPLRNMVVRIPGPSWIAYRLISKIVPVSNARLPLLDLDVFLPCKKLVALTDIIKTFSQLVGRKESRLLLNLQLFVTINHLT